MTMNSDGARTWAQLTNRIYNKSIAIVLDGYVYSAPNVKRNYWWYALRFTGHFTPEEV
jgi:SecD/SecF fusion protein